MNRWDGYGELYHHGIKGQKWGIRRYQNEDGSLTEEGKKRYYSGTSGDFEKEKYLEDTTAQSEKELTQENLGQAGSAARTALIGTLAAKTIAGNMLKAGVAAEKAAVASNAMISGANAVTTAIGGKLGSTAVSGLLGKGFAPIATKGLGAIVGQGLAPIGLGTKAVAGLGAKAAAIPAINAGKAAVTAMLGAGASSVIPIVVGGIILNTAIVATVNHFASKEKGYHNFNDQVNESIGKKAVKTGEWNSEEEARKDAREFTYYKKKLNQASNGSYNSLIRPNNQGYRYGFGGI